MSEYDTLSVVEKNGFAVLTINRPKALKALNETVLDELSMVFDELAVNGAVKTVILIGNSNKIFIAGIDITQQYEDYTFGN